MRDTEGVRVQELIAAHERREFHTSISICTTDVGNFRFCALNSGSGSLLASAV